MDEKEAKRKENSELREKKNIQTEERKNPGKEQKKNSENLDISQIKNKILQKIRESQKQKISINGKEYIGTGISGLDALFLKGIPRGSSILTTGGPGSGKTIFCLQTLYEAAKAGEKVYYITLEENPAELKKHMQDFGWDIEKYEKSGNFLIKKFTPADITRQIDAMIEKKQGELLIDLKPLIIPEGFKPDRIAVDSLSAVSCALIGKDTNYRTYIEELFNLFKEMRSTTFFICEAQDPTQKLSISGAEEFLADGVFIFYNIKHGSVRESAFEILKMRGSGFNKKIVPLRIKAGEGIIIYPEQEVFTII